jgi:predicted Mrr-cat superfamily restriction endonuclease
MLMSKTTITNNHTTQNNFNLNIFLNEKCKDALNMSDFISSLKVTIDDLLVTREHGLGESIGRILTHGLSTMDVYKRPIHCTDLKRDTMYVKDKEIWEKDEQNMKIKQAIDQLSYKQMITIDDWRHDQPDIAVDDELQLKYSTILLKVLTDPDEKNARKIIRLVGKETFLDKDVLLH